MPRRLRGTRFPSPWLFLLTTCALGALGGGEAFAWAPETRIRLTDEAVRMMPPSLRLALERHRRPLLRGMLDPSTAEDSAEHRPPSAGTLDASLAEAVAALRDALEVGAPFETVAECFGRIAHFVADAGFPPATGSGDARRYKHFAGFCESRRGRFPVVFYGHAGPTASGNEYSDWARAMIARSRSDDRTLAQAYAAAGSPPRADAFDDRSVPFAIGSLSYSRTFTDIVRVWLSAWREAGGDLGRTPYLVPPR